MSSSPWFAPRIALSTKRTRVLTIVSFLLPLLIWSAISYLPFLWHPKIKIVEPGDVSYFKINMLVDREVFDKETLKIIQANNKDFQIQLLSTYKNINKIFKQAKQFNVKNVIINNHKKYFIAK